MRRSRRRCNGLERLQRSEASPAIGSTIKASARTRVAVFPESATTDGDVVQHFHANLLQAAVDRACPLQPVALRYLNRDGSRCTAAAYVGEQTFAASLLAILAEPAIIADAEFLAPVTPRGYRRRELARVTEAAISGALGLPVVHRKPGTPAGPLA
jgi:1-acyl-sn-glycerol-3-phosphate acyltransferase